MDHIQRKLALIDKRLAKPTLVDFYLQIINTCPLTLVALGLIAGILIQNIFNLTLFSWAVILAICFIAAVALYCMNKKSTFLAALVFLCASSLGATRLIHFQKPYPNDIRNLVTDNRTLATIRGMIITTPHIDPQRWHFAKFTHTDPSTSFYLKLEEAETETGWENLTGTVRVRVNQPILDLKTGNYIQMYCWLDRFTPPANPGQFNVERYLARRNIHIAASVKSRDAIGLLKRNSKNFYIAIRRKLTQATADALLDKSFQNTPSQGLLEALLIGYRGNIDNETYTAFRETGLLHFISLSGLHLAIFIGIIWWLSKTTGLMKPARAVVCMIALTIFLLIVPPRAPTIRAAIIAYVFCFSILFRRHANSFNSLALAAIVLLLLRPTNLFEAGWQLSFTSVLGILLFTKRILSFLHDKIISITSREKTGKTKQFARMISAFGFSILQLFSVGFSAWLGGAGVLLYHFYAITPLTSLWTVIVFPFVAAILLLGYLKILLSFLLPTASKILAAVVAALAQSLIWLVNHIAELNISELLIGHVPTIVIIIYYVLIILVAYPYISWLRLKRAICTILTCVLIVYLGVTKYQRIHPQSLEMTCLDVGHGQAILLQCPRQPTTLFDAGSLYNSNVGQRIICPYLRYSGINKIDRIFISHNDVNHLNAIPEVTEQTNVNSIYANHDFLNTKDPYKTAQYLTGFLHQKNFTIQSLNLNHNENDIFKILWPTEKIAKNNEINDNDKSLVSLIEFAGVKILLPSDIEKFAQNEVLRIYPDIKADVLILPHHGSRSTLEPEFLRKLQPQILICSCGKAAYQNNRILTALEDIPFFCTPKHGAITISIDKNVRIDVKHFKNQK